MPPVDFEVNSGIRHKDFDDSIITSIYQFMDMYANGREIPVAKRSPVYDTNPDELFASDAVPEMSYDMLDAVDDGLFTHSTDATTTTTNDDDDATTAS